MLTHCTGELTEPVNKQAQDLYSIRGVQIPCLFLVESSVGCVKGKTEMPCLLMLTAKASRNMSTSSSYMCVIIASFDVLLVLRHAT